MHPHEAVRQRTGTGRLASLCLTGSEIIINKSFDHNSRVLTLLSDPAFYPMMLYPGSAGRRADTVDRFHFGTVLEGRTLLIFILDATWTEARKMMHRSLSLQKLPRLSFSRNYRSRFLIKTQPKEHCLSTIESVYYLVKELQEAGGCNPAPDPEGMMRVFDRMVSFQIMCREKNSSQQK
jgi:DTW domain-containing protein